MPYIVIAILIFMAVSWIFKEASNLITLQWLPSGIAALKGYRLLDGDVWSTVNLWWIFKPLHLIEYIINWLLSVFINIVDFGLWCICRIPIIDEFIKFVYGFPDIDLVLGWSHRDFYTHSVFNHYFLGTIIVFVILTIIFSKIRLKWGALVCVGAIVLTSIIFSTHLMSDALPKGWQGTALIKVPFIGALSGFLSKTYLLINAILALRFAGYLVEKLEQK